MTVTQVAERLQELGVARDATGRTLQRFDQYGREVVAVCGERRDDPVDVVVVGHHPVVRHGDRLATVAEREHAAVVAVAERHDLGASGVVDGERQRHQVGLRARVGEAHLLDRREPADDQLAEQRLVRVHRAEGPPAVDRGVGGGAHRGR